MKNLKYFVIVLMAIAVTACGSKNSKTSESSDAYADEVAATASSVEESESPSATVDEVATTATSTPADVDAMLNELESKLNRLAKMDDLSDEYDDLEDQIMDLMDRIDDQDMSAAQEKRYDKLDDKFDNM